jgi:hypothetical protein
MPALISKAFNPALRQRSGLLLFVRTVASSTPAQSTKCVIADSSQGFLRYERNTSRDPGGHNLNRNLKLDTPVSYLTRRLGKSLS